MDQRESIPKQHTIGAYLCSVGVQSAMAEMERLEQKGDATPEEIEALAQELSTKMLLTTWKATRWEVINVSPPDAWTGVDGNRSSVLLSTRCCTSLGCQRTSR